MIDRSARLWPQLSGIWTVAPQGGLAHLLVGTAAGVREAKMPANSPLLGATHWRLSPDGRRIATDPDRGLWVASSNGTHGTFLPAAMPRGCDMAQYQWLRSGAGLAYLQLCEVVGSPPAIRFTLYDQPLTGGAPQQIARLTSQDWWAIDIGGAYRCILCGY